VIIDKWNENDSVWFKFTVQKEYRRMIVSKGFIAVDGTSLTVCNVGRETDGNGWFTLMLVPHTQSSINLPNKSIGEIVNIEIDILNKIVEHNIQSRLEDIKFELK
jgi:riboflavin synthase